jgi:sec-independent protein translocase protein TatA
MAAGLLAALETPEILTANIFGPDILIIVVIALFLFGGKKFPEIAKGLGEGIRNFKGSFKEEEVKPEEKKQV